MPEVLTMGETMAVFVPTETGPLKYIQNFRLRYAGAESNTAVGLCKLGHSSEWISRLGDDELGRYVRSSILGEGVGTSYVKFDCEHPTGLMVKKLNHETETEVFYYRSRSAATYICPEDLDEKAFSNVKILHLTGITPVLSDSCRLATEHAIELAKRYGVMISFDPNIRQKLWKQVDYTPLMRRLIKESHILMMGIDEGARLYHTKDPDALFELLFQSENLRYAALKNGSNGAYVAIRGEICYIPPFTCKCIDPIGAGDAFNAGFLAGILEGKPLFECGRLAGIAGALCTQAPGDIEGIPDRNEIESRLNSILKVNR